MYRPGFGDCFLLTFEERDCQVHVLVDFGVHSRGDIGTLERIADNIESETGGRLEIVIASHAHRDHISGFQAFGGRFAQFERIGEVWMPWTEDPDNPKAVAIRRKHLALYPSLEEQLRLRSHRNQTSELTQQALDVLSNLRGNEKAVHLLATAFGTAGQVRYLRHGDKAPRIGGLPGLSARILGPPQDHASLARMDPPITERYFAGSKHASGDIRPFSGLEKREKDRDWPRLLKLGQPVLGSKQKKRFQAIVQSPPESLALVLDSVRNNSSLVILFQAAGRNLLFPGDAQWGSWQSMMSDPSTRDLLSDIDFLKVAHHGSHNATPRQFVEILRSKIPAVMVSTQEEPFRTIPRAPLIKALEACSSGGMVVRSDYVPVSNSRHKRLPEKLPSGFQAGDFWIDYTLE
jgi:hypothetical protein